MIIALDMSAAIEFVMGRPKQTLIANAIKQADIVIAPSLYIYESVNTLWKYRNMPEFPTQKLIDKAECLVQLVDEYINIEEDYSDILSLACETEHPAYDTAYMFLCLKNKAGLLTLDSRLTKAAQNVGVKVVLDEDSPI